MGFIKKIGETIDRLQNMPLNIAETATKVGPDLLHGISTALKLGALKAIIMAKLLKFAEKLHNIFMKSSLSKMDSAAAKRVTNTLNNSDLTKTMGLGKINYEPDKASMQNTKSMTNTTEKTLSSFDKSEMTAHVGTLPRQDVSELLKAVTEKNAADPMAMTRSGMSDIGKSVEKGRI